jgi:hypothetical protein
MTDAVFDGGGGLAACKELAKHKQKTASSDKKPGRIRCI